MRSWPFIDYQEAHCTLVLHLGSDLLHCWRGNKRLGHTKISILSRKTCILSKEKWRGDSRRCSFFIWFQSIVNLFQRLILATFSPYWWFLVQPVQQQTWHSLQRPKKRKEMFYPGLSRNATALISMYSVIEWWLKCNVTLASCRPHRKVPKNESSSSSWQPR